VATQRVYRIVLGVLTGVLVFFSSGTPAAQTFPTKPVRIIVPNPTGGASDLLARLLGKELAEKWGQTVIVENKPGASGSIGATYVAKSEPDGHTLLVLDASSLTVTPLILAKPDYQPLRDLIPVGIAAYSPHVLAVRKDLPVNDLEELIAYGKANPAQLNFGQTPGTITHLAGVWLARDAGFEWAYIGYKGTGAVLTDLGGGHIDAAMNSYLSTFPHAKAGNLKMIAIGSATRFSQAPELPAIAETLPGFESGSWQGVFAPVDTPESVVAQLNRDIYEVASRPEIQKRYQELGSERVDMASADILKKLQADTVFWQKILDAAPESK